MLNQSVRLQGTGKLTKRIYELRKNAPNELSAAMYLAVSSVVSTAMRLTPVDTGWLRSSRYVRMPTYNDDRFTIECGFSATYAIFVHEISKNYVVGEWKFLTKAVEYHAPTLLSEIARMAAGLFGSGKGVDSIKKMHPTEPMDDTNRAALEGLAGRYRRRKSKRTIAKRSVARQKNQERIARESAAALAAQRQGIRAPRPGRG